MAMQTAAGAEDHPLLGHPAPAFDLESATGERVALASRAGHIVVLFFIREFT
jgi:peroxiredoxin